MIHRNVDAALKAANIVDRASGRTLNAMAKGSALSRFESSKQRFWSALLISMKMPTVFEAIETEIAAGNVAVVQLVSTAEAILDRRLAELSPEERAHLDLELSPRAYVLSGDPDKTYSLQSRFMSSSSRAGADLREEDIDSTPDN